VDLTPSDAHCPVISGCQRSYGSTIEEVLRCAQIFIEEHRKQGILTSVKHFPGHGYASVDTHRELADITARHHPDEEKIYFELDKR
jgi:beta-N-acetylhexosaminidase